MIVPFPSELARPSSGTIDRVRPATIIVLPVVRIEREADEQNPPRRESRVGLLIRLTESIHTTPRREEDDG